MSASSAIQSLPAGDQTQTPQIRELDLLELRATTAEIRDRASEVAGRADALHGRVQRADLDQRAASLQQTDPQDLLETLAVDLGMPWSLVAELANVSATAVRKWRRGGTLTPDSRYRLARIVAFCQVIRELNPRITDPVLWLQTPLSVHTTLTAKDLYAAGAADGLLDVVAARAEAVQLLDRVAPSWRETHRPDTRHRVVMAPDGVPSIVAVD